MPGVSSREFVPAGVDPHQVSIARVYDAFLNGKDNYEIDRKVLQMVRGKVPEAQHMAFENRSFLIRAVRFLASQTGIDQFLDCGSGLPTAENVHQVAQRINPDARVVYIDNDPVVLAHGRALLEENDQTHFASADIFNPRDILENETVNKYLDLSEPLIFLQVGTFQLHDGPRHEPAQIMQEYIKALPSGSYVAFSHFLDPENEHSVTAKKMEEQFLKSPMGRGTFRTWSECAEFLEGLELLPPGLALCADWWPDGPRIKPLNSVQNCFACAVGRKP
jgi:SAM-dependent methyltransferase